MRVRIIQGAFDPCKNQTLGDPFQDRRIFEQEKTEETEVLFVRPLFSPFAPVQNSCADNRNKGH